MAVDIALSDGQNCDMLQQFYDEIKYRITFSVVMINFHM